jgi:hypothetical protein
VVLFGISTLSGAFHAGVKDLVTPLLLVKAFGSSFASFCKCMLL